MGIDAGEAGGMEPLLPAHHHLLGPDEHGIAFPQSRTYVRLPDALLLIAPLPVVGTTDGPTRIPALADTSHE